MDLFASHFTSFNDNLFLQLNTKEFFDSCWEQKPAYFAGSEEKASYFCSLFQPDCFKEDSWLSKHEYGRDYLVTRCCNGRRETLSEFSEPRSFTWLSQNSYSLQVHQPQRWEDNLWRLCASLEACFGSLVGCNAYVTPASAQGLAPHFDDVEIFVCQVQGSKKWRIFDTHPRLLSHCSGDLKEEMLGEAIMEITLFPGDVLYLPKGTIHCASTKDSLSSHLTISTYQRTSIVDLGCQYLRALVTVPAFKPNIPPSGVRGIPKELQSVGQIDELRGQLASVFTNLAESLTSSRTNTIVEAATNAFKDDFMGSRLPPHPQQVRESGPCPQGSNDQIYPTAKGFFHLFKEPITDSIIAESDSVKNRVNISYLEDFDVRLQSCLSNDRNHHMMPQDSDTEDEDILECIQDAGTEEEEEKMEGCMMFPGQYFDALLAMLSGSARCIKDLPLPDNVTDEEKVQLVKSLWALGAVGIVGKEKRGDKKKRDRECI